MAHDYSIKNSRKEGLFNAEFGSRLVGPSREQSGISNPGQKIEGWFVEANHRLRHEGDWQVTFG
ncbi:uncharacterized protein G2W53_036143 [Senna tora]|uniref:Uncharacterized protein n=1 Tax=Senna tora TaxID=362788 RepID=A0A834SVC8_9FABA|nr:uncharacterized protein G2W53_036143 [Senna tora]